MTKVELTGVPETALWNLYQRASAARAGHLEDPRAVEALARLDYPFERFDSPYSGLAARLHALRVRTVDTALRRVLAGASDATVVALGEGFETQFWRLDLREVPQAGGDRLLGVLRRVPGLKNRLPVIPVFQARLGHGAARDSAARDSAARG